MTKASGIDFALKMGRAHEANNLRRMRRGNATPGRIRRTKMDLHNNTVGARFALHRPKLSERELCGGLMRRLRKTRRRGLHGDLSRLVFTRYADDAGVIVGANGMGRC